MAGILCQRFFCFAQECLLSVVISPCYFSHIKDLFKCSSNCTRSKVNEFQVSVQFIISFTIRVWLGPLSHSTNDLYARRLASPLDWLWDFWCSLMMLCLAIDTAVPLCTLPRTEQTETIYVAKLLRALRILLFGIPYGILLYYGQYYSYIPAHVREIIGIILPSTVVMFA